MIDARRFEEVAAVDRQRKLDAASKAGGTADRSSRGLSAGRAVVLALLIMGGGYLVIANDPAQRITDITILSTDSAFREAIKNYRPLSFSVLAGFEYRDGMNLASLPAEIRAADGVKVALHGFMLPLDVTSNGVSQFLLNGSYDMCQFGVSAGAPNQWVEVAMVNGHSVPYTHLPITVVGTFSVGERRRSGRVVTLYRMAADKVIGSGQ
jgi:hypothetical protein